MNTRLEQLIEFLKKIILFLDHQVEEILVVKKLPIKNGEILIKSIYLINPKLGCG